MLERDEDSQRLALLECPCLGRGLRVSLEGLHRRERGWEVIVRVVRPRIWDRSESKGDRSPLRYTAPAADAGVWTPGGN